MAVGSKGQPSRPHADWRAKARWAGTIAAASLGLLFAPAPARAQTNCADIIGENKAIYGSGGSSIREALRRVGAALRAHDTLLLFSDGGGACAGFADYVAGSVPAARPYRYWNAQSVESTCIAPEAVPEFTYLPHPVDECADATLPAGVKDLRGPVESANLLTDIDSDYDSISAEAWKFLLLHGPSASGITPWTEDQGLIIRERATFVHVFVSKLVDVDPATTKGIAPDENVSTGQNLVTRISTYGASNPDAPIGYAVSSTADANRSTIKTLAFQGFGQTCGYWPDSNQYATDRRNVRNGLYAIWTPGHFFAEVDDDGEVVNEDVAELIGWFSGELESPPDIDVTRKVIETGQVPECAMRVTREGFVGAISSYAPRTPCDCYFESIATKKVPTECEACSTDDDCTSDDRPSCNYGFCELYRED